MTKSILAGKYVNPVKRPFKDEVKELSGKEMKDQVSKYHLNTSKQKIICPHECDFFQKPGIRVVGEKIKRIYNFKNDEMSTLTSTIECKKCRL